jgi:opacity protein-like surface antigen
VTKRPTIARRIIFCLFLPALALAQTSPAPTEPSPTPATPATTPGGHSNPVPIARAPIFVGKGVTVRASVGYAYTSLGMPSSNRVNLSGVDATVTADLSPRFGVSADSSYVRASNVLDTGRHADVLSYIAGPVFYPTRATRLTTYVHGLVGGARVTGVIPESGGGYQLGYVNRLSWVLGAGVEYQVSPSFAVRSGGDYQRTYFFNSDLAVRGQNGFRTVCSIVYVFWQHPGRRR